MARGIRRPRTTPVSAFGGGAPNSMQTSFASNFDAQGRYVPPKAPAPAPRPAPAAPVAPRPQAPAPNPQDSSYAASVARWLAQNQQARTGIETEDRQDREDHDLTLQRMARAKGIDLLDTNHQANNQGLFYSGQLTRRRGDVEHDYTDRETDANTAYQRRVDARQAALNQLGTITADPNSPTGYTATGGAAIDLSDIWNTAIDRANQNAQDLPLDTAPAAAAPTQPAAAPSTADLIKQWQNQPYVTSAGVDSNGNAGVWHHYKDGRPPVFIKGAIR